jgi:hypothetical protein
MAPIDDRFFTQPQPSPLLSRPRGRKRNVCIICLSIFAEHLYTRRPPSIRGDDLPDAAPLALKRSGETAIYLVRHVRHFDEHLHDPRDLLRLAKPSDGNVRLAVECVGTAAAEGAAVHAPQSPRDFPGSCRCLW